MRYSNASVYRMVIVTIPLAILTTTTYVGGQEVPEPSGVTPDYPPTAEWVIRDWNEALRYIIADDEKGFAAHMMAPEQTALLVHPMNQLIAAGVGAHERVAVVGATRPMDPRGGYDTFLAAGPFTVESEVLIDHQFESGDRYRMKLWPNKEYFLYVQMTIEKDRDERDDESLAYYRFQTCIFPKTMAQIIREVAPIKKLLKLKDDEYRFVTFDKNGESIRDGIEAIWAEE